MQRMYTGRISFGTIVRTLGTTATFCLLAGCTRPNYNTWVEEIRVTSPDGRFDAVMTREASPGGVLGSLYWNVFIVPKGASAPKDEKHTLFTADVLRGEKLVWTQKHLLDIRYDFAEIDGIAEINVVDAGGHYITIGMTAGRHSGGNIHKMHDMATQ